MHIHHLLSISLVACVFVLAVSLGEAIARRATRIDVEDNACQTSPRLLQSLRGCVVDQVDQPVRERAVTNQCKSALNKRLV